MTTPHKKTVCVDLDGVLAQYDGWKGVENIGNPILGAQAFVRSLLEFADVVIHTTRISPDTNPMPDGWQPPLLMKKADASHWQHHLFTMVGGWLDLHDFPAVKIWQKVGKPIAAAYVDDRAVVCRPQDPYKEVHGTVDEGVTNNHSGWYDAAIARCRKLCEV